MQLWGLVMNGKARNKTNFLHKRKIPAPKFRSRMSWENVTCYVKSKIMEKKYWEVILKKSDKKQTLPYIIGSKKILFPDSVLDTVGSLLEEIINKENDDIFSMYHCPDIGEYVIFYNKYKNYIINGLEVYNPKTGNLKIVFGMNMEVLGENFEHIKLKLSERYKSNVLDSKFSFEGRNWNYFLQNEKDKILSYIKS